MGEKFRGFKGNGFMLKFGLCLSICLSCISILFDVCMVEYIVETPPKVNLSNVGNEIQVHHTCIYCGGEFTLYIVILLTSPSLVVGDVSTIGLIWATIFVILDHIKYN